MESSVRQLSSAHERAFAARYYGRSWREAPTSNHALRYGPTGLRASETSRTGSFEH